MGRIVAIASGDLLSTRPLNKYAVKLAKKQNPNVLLSERQVRTHKNIGIYLPKNIINWDVK